jgi:hypothetical protein
MTAFVGMVYALGIGAAMLTLTLRAGLLQLPKPRRCGACGRLRRGKVCPCSERNA